MLPLSSRKKTSPLEVEVSSSTAKKFEHPGLRSSRNYQASLCYNAYMVKTTSILTALAGIIHATYVAAEHWSEFPQLEFVFFLSAGLAQIASAYLFFKKRNKINLSALLIANGAIFITWLFTRTISAPFQEGIEHIGILDSGLAILEIVSIFIALKWLSQSKISASATKLTLLIILSGTLLYLSSLGLELIFPDRVFVHTH